MEKNNRKVASTARQAALSTLGEQLGAARINAGLTQQRVAERLEATLQSVRNWEPGRSETSEEVVDTLAALYGVLSPHLTGQASEPCPDNSDQPPYQRVDVEPRLFWEPKKDVRTLAVRGILTGGVSIVTRRRYERGTVRPTRAMMIRLALMYENHAAWFEPGGGDSVSTSESISHGPGHEHLTCWRSRTSPRDPWRL